MVKEKEQKEGKTEKGKADEERLFAFLCYLISIVGVIIVLATKSERKDYSIYHAKQGLVLFIACIIVWIVWLIIRWIPILGIVVGTILWILLAILWIAGMINALTDRKVPLPIIGHYGERFRF